MRIGPIRVAARVPFQVVALLLLAAFLTPQFATRSASAQARPEQLKIGGPLNLSVLDWRTQCGDNPAWAAPGFDDSQWVHVDPRVPLPQDVALQGGRICWYRATVDLAPGSENLAILMEHTYYIDYDLYWNGRRVGGTGGLPPQGIRYAQLNGIYPLPRDMEIKPGRQVVVVRAWKYADFGVLAFIPGMVFGVEIGSSRQLDPIYQNTALTQLVYLFSQGGGLGLLIGLLALGLFSAQRERIEYLWLGIYGLSFAGSAVIYLVCLAPGVTVVWTAILSFTFVNVIPVAFIEFFCAFLGRKPSWWIRGYECSFAVPILLGIAGVMGKVNVTAASFSSNVLFLPGTVMLVVFLLVESRRKNPEAAILILPTFLAVGTYDGMTVLTLLIYAHPPFAWMFQYMAFHIGFLPIGVYPVCLSLFWLSMGFIIVRRHSRDTQEKARLNAEFGAARNVQQMLIPTSAIADSEFSTESVYLPANEVGGDFYQLLPGEDGSLLIVVGDVSGKGLSAAMTVSTIVGALRGCPHREPSLVLAHLNRILVGQISGFVTCCAALISATGAMTLANAGHIPPYRNGEEMAAESGLPLGLLTGIGFDQVDTQLQPGDRLTFVSDGVIEATNAHGELFGFERTLRISMLSAAEIAEAARVFGQEDDITVLVVQLAGTANLELPAAVPVAVRID